MATFKARALYEFNGEANTAELTIFPNEILTVTRTDVGEGWWEGLNSKGQSGLFPEAYVERMEDSKPPSIPAPVLNSNQSQYNAWDNASAASTTTTNTLQGGNSNQEEDWDDEWDNDDTYSEIGGNNNSQQTQQQSYYSNNEATQHSFAYGSSSSNIDNMQDANFGVDNKGTVTKKSLNRFSSYVKSGLESYILGTLKLPTSRDKIQIYKVNDNVTAWEELTQPYTVQVTSPKKESKMGGLKSFIAYRLTPSSTGIEVSRRYKHFDWLHDRLTEKFNIIAIPPLPDKQISGRYEDQFIEHRRIQLQEFVNYMCRHPVLSACDVWQHFLTCTDEKQWKKGKRDAEKDAFVGANFCLSLEAPDKELLASSVDAKLDNSLKYVNAMEQAIKELMNTSVDQQKKCLNMYKREYAKIGGSFLGLGAAFEIETGMFSELSSNIKRIGTTYIEIGNLFGEQAKTDWQPLADKLYLFRGVTAAFPDIINIQKNAEQKKKECEKTQVQQMQVSEIRRRTDVLTYAVFAELNHLQKERDSEFKLSMKTFLQDQVNFYKNIVRKLEDTLEKF